jgi:hypothetical protein
MERSRQFPGISAGDPITRFTQQRVQSVGRIFHQRLSRGYIQQGRRGSSEQSQYPIS